MLSVRTALEYDVQLRGRPRLIAELVIIMALLGAVMVASAMVPGADTVLHVQGALALGVLVNYIVITLLLATSQRGYSPRALATVSRPQRLLFAVVTLLPLMIPVLMLAHALRMIGPAAGRAPANRV